MTGPGSRRPRLVLAGCFLVTTGYGASMLASASVVPLVIESFAIQRADAGLAVSAGYLGWLILQLPSGLLMDRYDNRLLVLVSAAALLATGLVGLVVDSYPAFLAVRIAAGATGGILFTANANIVGHVFPPERRGLAVSTFVASGPAGMALGQFSAPLVAGVTDWRVAFVGYGALSVVGYLVFRVAIGDTRVRSDKRVPLRGFARALVDPSVLLISFSALCMNALFLFLNSWIPTYANEVLAIPLAGAGLVAAGVPVAGMLGRPSGGWISDRLGGRRRPVVVVAIALALPMLGAVPFLASRARFVAVLLAAGFTLQLGYGVYYAYVQDVVDPSVTGTSLAALGVFTILGGLAAPALGGWLVAAFSWTAAFAAFAGLGLAGIASVLLVSDS